MREVNAPRGDDGLKVVCAWCGGVISPAAAKPGRGMCQPCFAHMMREYSRAHQRNSGWSNASDR